MSSSEEQLASQKNPSPEQPKDPNFETIQRQFEKKRAKIKARMPMPQKKKELEWNNEEKHESLEGELGTVIDNAIAGKLEPLPEITNVENNTHLGVLRTTYDAAVERLKNKSATREDRKAWLDGHTFKPGVNHVDTERYIGKPSLKKEKEAFKPDEVVQKKTEVILLEDRKTDPFEQLSIEEGKKHDKVFDKRRQPQLVEGELINKEKEKWEEIKRDVQVVIGRIEALIPHLEQIDPLNSGETYLKILENWDTLQRIVNHIKRQTFSGISAEDMKVWEAYQSKEGWLFERIVFLEDAREKMEKASEPLKVSENIEAPQNLEQATVLAPDLSIVPVEPPPLPQRPREYDPRIKSKMDQIGIKPEMLEGMPEFVEIANSEGKIEWMLGKLEQLKRHKIHQEAVSAFEEHHRKEGKTGSIRRRILRNKYIRENEQTLAQGDFNIDNYQGDIADLIHLANVLPEIKTIEKDGKQKDVFSYVEGIQGVDSVALGFFNNAATDYANLPPENEWVKHSSSVRKEYEQVKKRYVMEKGLMLANIKNRFKDVSREGNKKGVEQYTEKDAFQILNNTELQVKMHQTLNNYPNAELELRDLAEAKGWKKHWDAAKSQLGIGAQAGATGVMAGGLGFGVNAGLLRTAVKSSLVMTGVATAAPVVMALSALGLGGFIGWKRGGMTAEKELRTEEDLMRFAAEEKKEQKSTDLNFVNAESLTKKIAHLRGLVGMEYVDYVKTQHVTLEEFETKKHGWTEQLEVRLEYTLQKLDKHKIAFGKENALAARYNLLREVGDATGELAFVPQQEKDIVNQYGKTRKGQLQKVLAQTEEKIETSRHEFIRSKQKKGMWTGIGFALAGYGIGHGIAKAVGHTFGSEVAHAVDEKAQAVKVTNFSEGKQMQDAAKIIPKAIVSHEVTNDLLEQENPSHVAMPVETAPIPTTDPSPVTPSSSALYEGDMPLEKNPFDVALESQYSTQNVSEISNVKPYELILTNESQSREFALIKYYEGKGLNHAEAGKKAHEIAKGFGPKGERGLPFVHKGDKISIIEGKDGEMRIDVIAKNKVLDSVPEAKVQEVTTIKDHQTDEFTHRKIGVDSAERAVNRTIRTNADEYGFMGDVNDKASVKDWANNMTQDVLKQNPELANVITHDGDKLQLIRNVEGKWIGKVNPAPEAMPTKAEFTPPPETESVIISDVPKVAEALESYEVTEPTNIISVTDKIFSAEPRYAALSQEGKDAFNLNFMLHYIDEAKKKDDVASFFKGTLGISSGNIFDIGPGKINLDPILNKEAIGQIFKDVAEGKNVDAAKNISTHFATFIDDMKKMDPADSTHDMILATLKGFKK